GIVAPDADCCSAAAALNLLLGLQIVDVPPSPHKSFGGSPWAPLTLTRSASTTLMATRRRGIACDRFIATGRILVHVKDWRQANSDEPPRPAARSRPPRDLLHLGVLVHREPAPLTAEAGLLEAAERRVEEVEAVVDPHDTRPDLLGQRERARRVA